MLGWRNGEGYSRIIKIHRIDYCRVRMHCKDPKSKEAATLFMKNLREVGLMLLIHRPSCQFS